MAWSKNIIYKQSIESILDPLASFLQGQNCKAYLVGGFVRDWLLSRDTADIDIAVFGNVIEISQKVAAMMGGKYVVLDETNQVVRVILHLNGKQWQLDFSPITVNIKEDLSRRDFTINAMAISLEEFVNRSGEFKLIDPFGGELDLKSGLVRAISEQIFEADPVRLLRAIRLAGEYDFKIEEKTEDLIRSYSWRVTRVPGERIREELVRLLALPVAGEYIRYLDKLNLLLFLIPELAEAKGVAQPKEHFWDVFDHSIETVTTIEYLLRERDWRYGRKELLSVAPWSEEIEAHLAQEVSKGSNRKIMLKLAGLLHDIAKPKTKTVASNGKMHFLGHAKEGAIIAINILEKLRFSSKEIKLVESLIYHHLRPAQMANKELPTHRAIYRYFRDTAGNGIDILFLALADYLATHGPNVVLEEWDQHCYLINYILGEYFKERQVPPPRLITGHDLIDLFGLTPGKEIGRLLAAVKEAQAAGEITNREEALALVERLIGNQRVKDV